MIKYYLLTSTLFISYSLFSMEKFISVNPDVLLQLAKLPLNSDSPSPKLGLTECDHALRTLESSDDNLKSPTDNELDDEGMSSFIEAYINGSFEPRLSDGAYFKNIFSSQTDLFKLNAERMKTYLLKARQLSAQSLHKRTLRTLLKENDQSDLQALTPDTIGNLKSRKGLVTALQCKRLLYYRSGLDLPKDIPQETKEQIMRFRLQFKNAIIEKNQKSFKEILAFRPFMQCQQSWYQFILSQSEQKKNKKKKTEKKFSPIICYDLLNAYMCGTYMICPSAMFAIYRSDEKTLTEQAGALSEFFHTIKPKQHHKKRIAQFLDALSPEEVEKYKSHHLILKTHKNGNKILAALFMHRFQEFNAGLDIPQTVSFDERERIKEIRTSLLHAFKNKDLSTARKLYDQARDKFITQMSWNEFLQQKKEEFDAKL